MPKNAYAAKLMAAKGAVSRAERAAIVNRCITTIFQASAVALNEQFGFGPERIARFREGMERTINEYGALLDAADADYADGKLEQRYLHIMGEEKP